MSEDTLIGELCACASRIYSANGGTDTWIPGNYTAGLISRAADALAAKDTALSEMRAELERAQRVETAADSTYTHWRNRATAADAQLEQDRKALERFAAKSATVDSGYDDGIAAGDMPMVRVFVKDLRAAARALSQDEPAYLGVGG